MKRRRQRRNTPHEHSNHERWLVSYADFMTLLFAFFVVLYASAQVDNRKVAQVAAAIKGAFQQLGVFTGNGSSKSDLPPQVIVIQGPGNGAAPQITLAPPDKPIDTTGSVAVKLDSSANNVSRTGGVDSEALKKQIEEALGDDIKKKKVRMRVGPDGFVVSLSEIGFFDSGDAKLLPEAKPVITRLAKILEDKNFEIRVEGHTDNVPIHTPRFNSNWELSTARATEVVSMLVHDYGFDPSNISIAGYAEFRPVYSNDTEEGRKANRRIDLVIIGLRKSPSASALSTPTATP